MYCEKKCMVEIEECVQEYRHVVHHYRRECYSSFPGVLAERGTQLVCLGTSISKALENSTERHTIAHRRRLSSKQKDVIESIRMKRQPLVTTRILYPISFEGAQSNFELPFT